MSGLFSLPTDCIAPFDSLHVVSDLHLGGMPGFQIFKAGETFGKYVDELRKTNPNQRVALLINGDLVDFLAEDNPLAFDPIGAIAKLTRITEEEPAFAPIWTALRAFVATKNRWLLINLGNHDLELALPWVREKLLRVLAGDDDAARGRLRLTFDGTGIRCRVGNEDILALHGNEVDTWNVTDFERLRRIGLDLMMGQTVDDWVPNAGSQLVINVMNSLKHRFPFIDLLKPEQQAVLPTLFALAPDQRDKLMAIASVATRLGWDSFRRSVGWLGQADPSLAGSSGLVDETQLLPDHLRMGMSHPDFKETLLKQTEERFNERIDPMTLVNLDQQGQYLGWREAFGKWFGGSDPAEVLREALEKLQEDKSFDLTNEDDTFCRLDEKVGDGPTFIVAGHTHLERAIKRKRGRGWYFNSGTWVRLIQLKPEVLRDKTRFKEIFETFKGNMAMLDARPDLIIQQLTVVHFWVDGAKTFGELQHVTVEKNKLNVTSVPGTRFPEQ